MVSSSKNKGWQLIAKIQKRTERSEDWCIDRVTAIISALVICIIVCLSWAVNHYRDNAITYKPSATKNARGNWKLARNAAITDMQMRQRDVAALDAKYTKELADAALKMMLSAWWCVPLVVVGCTSKPVCQSVRGNHHPPPAWIISLPDWQTPLNGIISYPQKYDHYAKTTGRNQYINEQCR